MRRQRNRIKAVCGAWVAAVLLVAPWRVYAQEPSDFIEVKSADHIRYDAAQRIVRASGNVRFAYQEVEVSADELAADLRANTAVLSGNVVLRTQGEEFRGETLLVRLDTREWEFTATHSAISPDYFERGVTAPLYVGARQVVGFPDRLMVRRANFTTCDLPEPHYEVTARRLRIWPGQKLIADDAGFWLLGKRVFTMPWFVVPLREARRQPFIPLVGEDDFQGRYLKTTINYVRSSDSYGSAHLDFMSRRGFGQGIEHTEAYPRGRSDLYVYHVNNTTTGAEEWTARGAHQQDLGGGLALRASADFRSDSFYYLAGSRVANAQLGVTRQRGGAASALAFDYSRTSGFTDFTRFSTSLRHDARGPRYGVSLDSRYDSHSTFAGEPDDLELTNRLEVTDHQSRADLRLVLSKRLDLDDDDYTGDDFYQVVDRMPELVVETDTYRLRGAPLGLPARLTLGVGNFSERPTNLDAYRVYFGYQGIPDTIALGPCTRINAQARFQQFFYGDRDRTAQYAYGGNLRLEQDFADRWQARLGYLLLEPKGYTPFNFDYVGAYRSAALDLEYRRGEQYRARLRTGYDVRYSRWQDIVARMEAPLHRNLRLGLSAGYDPNRGVARDLVARVRFGDYRTALDLSARYQPQQGKLQRATAYLDWVATPKWRIQVLSSYDGVQDKFVYGEFLITRDLHCWQALAYYSLQRDLFRLDFRIKAFEWGRPDFGVGRSGQYLDTSLGEWY